MSTIDTSVDLDELFGMPPAKGEVMAVAATPAAVTGNVADSAAEMAVASGAMNGGSDHAGAHHGHDAHEGHAGADSLDAAERMTSRIGGLMRTLRDSMRELGLDKHVEQAAEVIPDARDRLRYIATMTEQAAERALNATDVAMPLADRLGKDAGLLDGRWKQWYEAPQDIDTARALVVETRGFLQTVPVQSAAINTQLMEIMLAQDFQDLTGQVIKKVMDMVHHIEQQLLGVLLENITPERRAELISMVGGGQKSEGTGSLLNGPQVNTEGKTDIVTDQTQVDDLLTELGF